MDAIEFTKYLIGKSKGRDLVYIRWIIPYDDRYLEMTFKPEHVDSQTPFDRGTVRLVFMDSPSEDYEYDSVWFKDL